MKTAGCFLLLAVLALLGACANMDTDTIADYFPPPFDAPPTVGFSGAVRNKTDIVWTNGLTLITAIELAGGFKNAAPPPKVTVMSIDVRDGRVTEEKVYNLKKIMKGTAQDPLLKGGDIVAVPYK